MASQERSVAENVPGDFFVDRSCIDCDTCRWRAPATFADASEHAYVARQPATVAERLEALRALVACPTGSIGTREPQTELKAAAASFPLLIEDQVYDCGYHAESSFGATSYLIRRAAGNVLVDSPRFARLLVRRVEELGGVRWLYLTHRDDVADHRKWRDHFGCERVLHRDDVTSATRDVEIQPEGEAEHALAPDLRLIPVPGHTRGSTVLLHADRHLFTGDHLAWSPRLGHLYAFRDACWYSWSELERSMRKLVGLGFSWVLPGHGRRCHASPAEMQASLARCLAWMATRRAA
jgi:glyoxylase-like metal-dependent hydrolase (beta-lactamase superfamily II)/ferredoxin